MTEDNLLHFVCAKCETHLSVEGARAGLKAPCPSCGKEITAPEQKAVNSGASSLEKVKMAVESKPAKPDAKTSLHKETQKVKTAAVEEQLEPINPKSGLTKSQEEMGEFHTVVKAILLGGIGLLGGALAIYYNQEGISKWLESTF